MSDSAKNRLDTFQSIGTALALVISIMALGVSMYEANLMREQQSAMVWPYLTLGPSFSSKGFSFKAQNNGTGPAIIKSVEVRFKDTLMTNYDELLDAIKPDRTVNYDVLTMSNFNETVMKSGEEREVFSMPWNEETRTMYQDMMYVKIKVCYCSVLGDCWIFDSEENSIKEGTFKAEREFEN